MGWNSWRVQYSDMRYKVGNIVDPAYWRLGSLSIRSCIDATIERMLFFFPSPLP